MLLPENFRSASIKIAILVFDCINNRSQTPVASCRRPPRTAKSCSRGYCSIWASSPILAGAARPGTPLVDRSHSVDGSILAERSIVADAAGNWMVQLPGMLPRIPGG